MAASDNKGLIGRRAVVGALGAGTGALVGLGTAKAQSGKPITVGMSMPLQLQLGRDAREALTMAIEDVNREGGLLGRPVAMAFADETDSTESGVSGIRKLISDDDADVLIGSYTSGIVLAAMPHIARAKKVTLIIGASSPSISERVRQEPARYKYIFRLTINANNQSAQLLDFISGMLVGELGLKKIALLAENARWAQDIVAVLSNGAKQTGAEIVTVQTVDTATTDFSPVLANVRNSGAEFMMLLLGHAKGDILIKQWYDARVPVLVGGVDGRAMDADYFKLVDGKCLSMLCANFAVRAPITPRTVGYFDRFKARTGHFPSYTAWTADNALRVYVAAVKRAGTIEADRVVAELEKTDFPGIEGNIVFDAGHDAISGPGRLNFVFAQWQAGGERAVLWPKEDKSGSMILPPWISKMGKLG